jgi:prepilin-type N-terminal cleavage/methylation domain-containing protein
MREAKHTRCGSEGAGHPKSGSILRQGLTLIEVLVVIAIIGVLAGLLIPAVQSVRESGRRSACANNLKQLGAALSGYQARDGRFPPAGRGYSWCVPGSDPRNAGDTRVYNSNGLVELLPFLDQQMLFDRFDLNVASGDMGYPTSAGPNWLNTSGILVGSSNAILANARSGTNVLSVFRCGSDSSTHTLSGNYGSSGVSNTATTNYDFTGIGRGTTSGAANDYQRCNTWKTERRDRRMMFGQNSMTTPGHVIDGLSNTFALAETMRSQGTGGSFGFAWAMRGWSMFGIDPEGGINIWTLNTTGTRLLIGTVVPRFPAASLHPGGSHFVTADGATHFFAESTDRPVLESLSRMADEKVSWP